jgi:dTDP-4-dehydrorhamnose reductase
MDGSWMKILLFGKTGQVGWELQRSLAPLGELVALDRMSEGLCGELTDLDGIAATIRTVEPDVVVNTAAYTAVDRAESEPDLCRIINSAAPEVMAIEAQRIGAWMVHYSTDYVFDGSGTRPWSEDDVPAPINVYGQTKAEGERRLAAASSRHLIFRTSWVYADRGANFLRTMLRLAQERDHLSVVDDQWGAPTGAALIADVTAHALRAVLGSPQLGGLYHLTAQGETSWYGYAKHLIEVARGCGWPVKAGLRAVPSSAYPTAARRPHNSRLNNSKLEKAFGLRLPPWQQGVERVVASSSR